MVIEPLSLIFFRVPSCAPAGTATATASAARIRVIGRVMSVSLWAVRVGGWMVGEAARFYGSPPLLVQAAPATAEGQSAPGGLEFDLLSEKERDMSQAPTRIEHDLLGDRAVPADAYYGIHTLRALENFPITGTAISIYPELVSALACVKQAAAIANSELGLIDERRATAIRLACEEVREGKLHEEFVVDVIQGGAGTSSNMNANEVICNRALEILGHARGEYQHLHPL